MKNALLKGSLAFSIGVGGILMAGCQTEKPNSETKKISNNQTINTKSKHPWEVATPSKLEDDVNNGKVVFSLSDGDALENKIKKLSLDSTKNKAHYSESWSKYLGLYILQLEKKHPEKKSYFGMLKEIQLDLKDKKFKEIPKKIKEAKTLREGK